MVTVAMKNRLSDAFKNIIRDENTLLDIVGKKYIDKKVYQNNW